MAEANSTGKKIAKAKALISKRSVDGLAATGKTHYLWDTKLPGFGVRVTPAGAKSYVYQFRMGGRGAQVRREFIGPVGTITPDQGRTRAQELAHKAKTGTDPIEEKRAERKAKAAAKLTAEHLAFDAYCRRYLDLRVKPEGLASFGNIEMVFRLHAVPVLKAKPLFDIAKSDIVAVLDGIAPESLGLRRSTYAILNKMLNWAVERGDLAANPMAGMKRPPAPGKRQHVLSDDELVLALRASADLGWPFGALYELVFATGARREEIAALDWRELDRASASWRMPNERAKNDETALRPLNRRAVAVLDSLAGQDGAGCPQWPRAGFVLTTTGHTPISGFSRSKARLDGNMLAIARADAVRAGLDPEEVLVAPWRLHDARRTIATGMQRLGVPLEVSDAILTHSGGVSRAGIAGVYHIHDWGPEKRDALDLWSACMDALLAGHRQSDFRSSADRDGHRGWRRFITAWSERGGPPPAEVENVVPLTPATAARRGQGG